MPAKNKSKLQTKIMTTWLLALVGLSLILLLYEKVKITEKSGENAGLGKSPAAQVAGGKIDDTAALESYRAITGANFLFFQELVLRQSEKQDISIDLTNLRLALLATAVPPIYKNLHFRLARLADELGKDAPDYLLVEEQERFLLEQYPWLLK